MLAFALVVCLSSAELDIPHGGFQTTLCGDFVGECSPCANYVDYDIVRLKYLLFA